MFKAFLKIFCIVLACTLFCTACSITVKTNEQDKTQQAAETDDLKEKTKDVVNVRLTLESGETIDMELYPNVAPLSVKLFLKGVDTGYYNGTVFHRAVPGFMIQGGSTDGTGGMNETIRGEFSSNGFENNLKHTRGVVSLARTNAPNSASGQFFIVQDDSPHLDGNYAAFGKVTSGMEVVDIIANMPTESEILIEKPVIKSITRTEP